MAQRILGVDLGAWAVKAVLLESTYHGFAVLEHGSEVLPPPEEGKTLLSRQVAALQQLVETRDWTFAEVMLALPGAGMSSSVLTLPFVDLRRIEQTLPFEVEEQVPFELTQMAWDWQSLGTRDGKKTQALVTCTLGTADDAQKVESFEGETWKSFMLHYNFPPFSVGEVGFMRGPGRREVGHGALAERSLAAMMPAEEQFPYTVRIVSDILESNGSSSMASVCGGSLAMMDAGVPLAKPVAGIAMGLVMDEKSGKYAVLSDIAGAEDHYGDMDFKVAAATRYFAEEWLKPAPPLPTTPGHHRVVWDLRGPRPKVERYTYSIAAIHGEDTPAEPEGPLVPPGRYTVRLTVAGKTYAQPVTLKLDPRVTTPETDIVKQVELATATAAQLDRTQGALGEVRALRKEMEAAKARSASNAAAAQAVTAFDKRAAEVENDLKRISARFAGLFGALSSGDAAPTAQAVTESGELRKDLEASLAKWNTVRTAELSTLNERLRAAGVAPIGSRT
jgi:hypothetical protein